MSSYGREREQEGELSGILSYKEPTLLYQSPIILPSLPLNYLPEAGSSDQALRPQLRVFEGDTIPLITVCAQFLKVKSSILVCFHLATYLLFSYPLIFFYITFIGCMVFLCGSCIMVV